MSRHAVRPSRSRAPISASGTHALFPVRLRVAERLKLLHRPRLLEFQPAEGARRQRQGVVQGAIVRGSAAFWRPYCASR